MILESHLNNHPFFITFFQKALEYVYSIHRELKVAREVAGRNIVEAQKKYKTQQDKKAAPPEFKVHNRVWLRSKKKPIGLSPKLCDKWLGPYYIIIDNQNNTYNLRHCDDTGNSVR